MLEKLKAFGVRHQTSLISTIIGIAILSLAVLCLAHLDTVQQSYEQTAIQNANKYTVDAEATIKSNCSEPTAIKSNPNCIRKAEYTARQNQRSEHELAAQKSDALWNSIMGKSAVIGIAIGLVSIWLIFATFRATRETAVAGFRANEIAQRAQRPWVEFVLGNTFFRISSDKLEFGFDAKCLNHGLTPATEVWCSAIIYLGEEFDGSFYSDCTNSFHDRKRPRQTIYPGKDGFFEDIVEFVGEIPNSSTANVAIFCQYFGADPLKNLHTVTLFKVLPTGPQLFYGKDGKFTFPKNKETNFTAVVRLKQHTDWAPLVT